VVEGVVRNGKEGRAVCMSFDSVAHGSVSVTSRVPLYSYLTLLKITS
jgi:hypothetical protein